MTDANKTYVKGVIDRSGSMFGIAKDTAGAWNAFVAEQAKQDGECYVSLTEFDNKIDVVYDYVLAADAPEYTLGARGSTSLLDAIGSSISELGIKLAALPEDERPGAVVVVILTDGGENSSREYNREQVAKMIKEQTDVYSWQFVFLGADMDSVNEARNWGISVDTSAVYDTSNVAHTMDMFTSNVSNYRVAMAAGASPAEASDELTWTDAQRKEAVKK